MDKESRVLTETVPDGVPRSYRARADHYGVSHTTLHHRARGRPSMKSKAQQQQYLTPAEEKAVVDFVLQMSALGYPVRIKYIPSLAFSATRIRPASKRPAKPPGKNWARALEKRHPELHARRIRALDWNRHEKNTYDKISRWFDLIKDVLHRPDILRENVYNMDETGVMLSMLGSVKVLVGRADTRHYRGAHVKRTTVTAIECISAAGRYLHPMIIWPATTHRSNWTTFPTPGWHYACSESGYTNSQISLEWFTRVFDPQTRDLAASKPRVLICDGFGTHETVEILDFCFANNIILCRLPSHTSDKLQPCDVAVFAPLKAAYRDNVERLDRGGTATIGKQHFTSLYSPARELAFCRRNIVAGWSKAGLFPFNPDRVLRELSKPASSLPSIAEVAQSISAHNSAPRTPLTPMCLESLMSLQNIIVQHDAATLDNDSKEGLLRHLQKITKATSTLYATNIFQTEQIQFLHKKNSEAEVRRTTKSVVLGRGEGRVMSYDDLVAARLKRAEKDAAKEHGAQRGGRKRKVDTEMSNNGLRLSRATATTATQSSNSVAIEESTEVITWQAPVARMY